MTELLASFRSAVQRLDEAVGAPATDLNRDAGIQRFEFRFELAWKSVQKCLRKLGIDRTSPRDCLREAWKQGWLTDEAAWLEKLADRNLTTHTYDDGLAKTVHSRLPRHLASLRALERRLTESSVD